MTGTPEGINAPSPVFTALVISSASMKYGT
jgi:hypothetical protein